MKKWTDIFHQTLMISTGILFTLGIEGCLDFVQGNGDRIHLPWYQPFTIITTGFLCSLAIRILSFERAPGKREWMARIAAHFLINLLIVLLMGYLAKWYDSRWECLLIIAFYVMIYVFVWAGMFWFAKYEERLINQALGEMCDKE